MAETNLRKSIENDLRKEYCPMKYSIKLIIKYTVEMGEIFFEESILMLEAESFDDAYRKIERWVSDNGVGDSYRNLYGRTVQKEIVSYADCFSVYDDDEVTEVYSSFQKPRPDLPEKTLVAAQTESCGKEELLPLRRYPG